MVAVELMTQAEYARHRGISQEAVRMALKNGRISGFERGGRVLLDPTVADAQWLANTQVQVDKVASQSSSCPEVYNLASARAKREHHEANISAMKEREKAKDLVDRRRLRKGAVDIAAEIRLSMEQIPSKLGARLAAESEPSVCREMLSREIRSALADGVARLRKLTALEGADDRRADA